MKTMPDVTGVILAGGASSRFGSNKALASFQSIPLIQHVSMVMAGLFSKRLLITNTPDAYAFLKWPMEKDIYENSGPLGGIHAALHTIKTSKAFIVGCDMPLLNPVLIAHLCSLSGNSDVTIPWLDNGPEPLYGVYNRQCLDKIEENLQKKVFKITKVLSSLRLRKIGQDEILDLIGDLNTFLNINFHQDLDFLMKQISRVSHG